MNLTRTTIALCLSPTLLLAEPPKVVTDFAPTHSLAAQVMDGVGTPELLLPQGAEPHGFQMRPSQMRSLSDADLLIWVGPAMAPWLERAIEGTALGHSVALLSEAGTVLREGGHDHDHGTQEGEEHDDHDHADEHGHDDHEHDAHDDHDHATHNDHAGHEDHERNHEDHTDHDHAEHIEGVDPHAWLSPLNAQLWLEAIAEELSELDPANADRYHENATEAQEKIAALDSRIKARLEPVHEKGFVVFHDAHGYFTDHYGLNVLGAIRESDAATPSAARMSEIAELIAHGNVRCVFSEPGIGNAQVAELAQSGAAGIGVLDQAGATLEIGPMLYENLMWQQADTIASCLENK
ncbi:zinc ABC transporter substrate-binding protein [Aliiroseovarius sp. PrR006]|uniref:zinc ABC transporter substrate-binding protein n=1 Tax=Aliiroseovarius sp. PrR006 TaxID=2706883 RepID=UPI0013D36234|nr:zinc ABC transporter substrate-binding protein [Aliiroseovarius sp. PrR006]NDW54853.1 zinc ABC transporter solute-binding protein [Aliiroseovarius sp. PrR006]